MDEIEMVDKRIGVEEKQSLMMMMMDLVPDARTSANVLTHRLERR